MYKNILIMGRRRKKKEKVGLFQAIKQETLHGVLAVFFLVLGIFFVLTSFDKAGFVGNQIHTFLVFLFGVGFWLIPALFFMLFVSFLRDLERDFAAPQIVGSIIFFLSSLGIITLIANDKGGVVGSLTSKPLIALFDIYATGIILGAFVVISLLVIFDAPLKINPFNIFKRKERDEDVELSELENSRIEQPEEDEDETPIKVKAPVKESSEESDFVPIKVKSFTLKEFDPPPLSLLEKDRGKPGVGDIKANANIIKRTLQNFGIIVEMDEVSIGPSVTRYALKPAEGVKLSRIVGLQNNLELALAAHPVRIEAPIPGKSLVGIEIPNSAKTTVGLGSLLSLDEFQKSPFPLIMSLGKAISGKSVFANLSKMPHLLIAGATGSGKSVTIHALVNSLLFRNPPENLKFIMIDPKRVELTLYNKIPHLLTPVITDAKKSILALKWLAKEMDRRYDILEESSVRDISSYHKNILEPHLKKIREKRGKLSEDDQENAPETMPYIVVVIDELADIMQAYPRELESAIVRLAQMSRAVGIHLVLSTQRPSVNVITGLIKANIPSRIALQVASQVDSRTILDASGAEKLLGAGDMLYMSGDMSKPVRVQSAFISEEEVKSVAKYLAKNYESDLESGIEFSGETVRNSIFESTIDDEPEDELYEDARETIMRAGKASTSYLQRKLGVGYARAARLMDMLEERGVVGPQDGSKPREVLDKLEDSDPEAEDEYAN